MHTDRCLNITHRLTDALVKQRASNTATLTVSLSLHSVHMSRLFTTKHRKHNGPAYNCQNALFSRFTSILLDVQNMSSIQSTRLVNTLRFLRIILMVLSVLLSTNARNHGISVLSNSTFTPGVCVHVYPRHLSTGVALSPAHKYTVCEIGLDDLRLAFCTTV